LVSSRILRCTIPRDLLTPLDRFHHRVHRVRLSVLLLRITDADFESGAWFTFLLRCRPMEGYWDHNIGASCYSMDLFKSLGIANTGRSRKHTLSTQLLIPVSFQHGYRHFLRELARYHYLEPSHVSPYTRLLDRSSESRLPVGSDYLLNDP
jgi:hypothetical protein